MLAASIGLTRRRVCIARLLPEGFGEPRCLDRRGLERMRLEERSSVGVGQVVRHVRDSTRVQLEGVTVGGHPGRLAGSRDCGLERLAP